MVMEICGFAFETILPMMSVTHQKKLQDEATIGIENGTSASPWNRESRFGATKLEVFKLAWFIQVYLCLCCSKSP